MGLEVTGRAKPLVAYVALMRLFTSVNQPSQQCYAGPVRDPYRFGRGRCSGPAWANRTGLIYFSVLSLNQKLKHANKLTFSIILKKEQFE